MVEKPKEKGKVEKGAGDSDENKVAIYIVRDVAHICTKRELALDHCRELAAGEVKEEKLPSPFYVDL